MVAGGAAAGVGKRARRAYRQSVSRPALLPPSVLLRAALLSALFSLGVCLPLPVSADQSDPRLPELFAQLSKAPDSEQAGRIASEIWNVWTRAGDAELDQLMAAGSRELAGRNFASALQIFSELIERAPSFAEAWNKRATTYYHLRDYEASMRDVSRVLELEPRHFAALSGMGLIYTALEADAPALRWFERAERVHPYLLGVSERIAELRKRLDDSGI